MTEMTGGCACGQVRFTARNLAPTEAYLCHCRMCQRAAGSISLAMVNVKQVDVTWEREPNWYDSSPIARRPFCATCGTSLGFRFKEGSEWMDLTVASFDDTAPFKPTSHFGAENIHRAWLNTEGLPEKRSDEHQPLMERWSKAGGAPA